MGKVAAPTKVSWRRRSVCPVDGRTCRDRHAYCDDRPPNCHDLILACAGGVFVPRHRVHAAGAELVRGRGVPAATDVRGGLAEPAPLGSAGPDPLCRTGQLARGADRRHLRQLAAGDRGVRRAGGACADGARACRGLAAGPAASGQRVLPDGVRAAVDLRADRDRGAVALAAGAHRRSRQHAVGSPRGMAHRSGTWPCRWCRPSPSGPTSVT